MKGKEIKRHSVYWLLITVISSVAYPLQGGLVPNILGYSFILSNYLLIYYFLGFYVYPQYRKKRYVIFFFWLIICFAIYYMYYFFIIRVMIPGVGALSSLVNLPVEKYITSRVIWYLFIIIAVTAWSINRTTISKISLQNENEKILIQRELNYLKSQFNSHLTFNFFSYCYSHVYMYSEVAAESIEAFTDLIRYSLHFNPEKTVPLREEIEYTEKYISFQRLLSKNLKIHFNITGEITNKYIVPKIIVSLVEKAILNGQSDNPDYHINFELNTGKDFLEFKMNTNKLWQLTTKTLENDDRDIRALLDVFYGDNYELQLRNHEKYSCYLRLSGIEHESA